MIDAAQKLTKNTEKQLQKRENVWSVQNVWVQAKIKLKSTKKNSIWRLVCSKLYGLKT